VRLLQQFFYWPNVILFTINYQSTDVKLLLLVYVEQQLSVFTYTRERYTRSVYTVADTFVFEYAHRLIL